MVDHNLITLARKGGATSSTGQPTNAFTVYALNQHENSISTSNDGHTYCNYPNRHINLFFFSLLVMLNVPFSKGLSALAS